MPTYEYECQVCHHVQERWQQMTDARLTEAECPVCQKSQPVTRLIGAGSAPLFKGDGFYQTDYRSAGYKEAAKAEGAGPGKADAKPAESPAAGKGEASKAEAAKPAAAPSAAPAPSGPSTPSTPSSPAT